MRTTILSTVSAAALALGASSAFSPSTQAADGTLVWSTMGSTKNPIVRCGPSQVAKKITEITGHKEEMHLGGTAFANPRKQYTQLSRGVTDYTWGPLSYTPGRFPLSEILTLPFVGEDNKIAAKAMTSLKSKYPALAKETGDIHLLALAAAGPYHLHLKKPVESLTDLSGLRLRIAGTPLSNSVKKLGGDVVAMPMPQVYENMQKGVIDGSFGTAASLVAFKINEVSTSHLKLGISVAIIFTGISKKYYDGLPAGQRSAIDAALGGPDAAARYSSCWDKVDVKGWGLATKRGNAIRDLRADERAAVEKKLQPVIDDYLSGLDKKGLPASAIYNDLLKEIKRLKSS